MRDPATGASEAGEGTVDRTWKRVALYTAVVTLVAILALLANFHWIEQSAGGTSSGGSSPSEGGERLPLPKLIMLVLVAGAIGGCLFNIHSLVKHVNRGDFKPRYAMGYYFCPVSGALCGLVVVIFLLGGVLTLGLVDQANKMALEHPGRLMPFVAIAIIAGYGSRQFKLKLDELAETLFRTKSNTDNTERP